MCILYGNKVYTIKIQSVYKNKCTFGSANANMCFSSFMCMYSLLCGTDFIYLNYDRGQKKKLLEMLLFLPHYATDGGPYHFQFTWNP